MVWHVGTVRRRGPVALGLLLAACSTASSSDEGSSLGPTSLSEGTEAGSQSNSTGTSTEGSSSTGPVLDVGSTGDATAEGGETGGTVPLTCDNIEMQDDTSVGCEFWATNWVSRAGYGMAIGVGNPSDEVANVYVEQVQAGVPTQIASLSLPARGAELIQIDGPGGAVAGTIEVAVGANPGAALRVVSDVPITAMQVSPAGGGPTHISEASLLLPQNALRETYFAIGYPGLFGEAGRVAVVGTEDGTTVTTSDGSVTLDRFDVHVFSMDDATGYYVGADKAIAVFSGTANTNIPSGMGASDHLQEQVVPAASWGTQYVGGRHPVRYTASNLGPEPVYWRVVAGEDDTTISLSPAVSGASITIPNAGGFVEFSTPESFVAESDKPFALVQYMSGCINVVPQPLVSTNPCNEPATGDPYMIQIPPTAQWLDALPFLTDSSYPRDFVVVMREAGTSVNLDCLGEIDASHFQAIPGTNYEVGAVDLDISAGQGTCQDGAQFLTASAPVGVIVGGMDWATSYGYPGGLSFQDLWTPPFDPPG